MIELALTRIFSVTMYYHFAFLAISIALFGLSASGVYVYVARARVRHRARRRACSTIALAALRGRDRAVALAALVRIRVGLNYSHANLREDDRHLRAGGAALLHRRRRHLARHLPILQAGQHRVRRGPHRRRDGMSAAAAAAESLRRAWRGAARGGARRRSGVAVLAGQDAGPHARWSAALAVGIAGRRSVDGHRRPSMSATPRGTRTTRCCSASGIRSRAWRCTTDRTATGRSARNTRATCPKRRFMDIDSAASTPILRFDGDLSKVEYLRYELTGLAYHLVEKGSGAFFRRGGSENGARPPFSALVIGPGGGRDLLTALVFGAEPRRRRRGQPDHRERRHARTVPGLLGIDLRRTRASTSSWTTGAASSGDRTSATTSSRPRSSIPGPPRPPAPIR